MKFFIIGFISAIILTIFVEHDIITFNSKQLKNDAGQTVGEIKKSI